MKRMLASVLAGLFLTGCFSLISVYSRNEELCDKFVRVHIIADSDSAYDQHMKYVVRDAVFQHYEEAFARLASKEETLAYLQENREEIQQLANQVLWNNGYGGHAVATVSRSIFPQKDYGCFTLPAGHYDALKIVIGSGKGKNFFCVMFPPLCVSPAMDPAVKAEDVLSREEVREISETKPVLKFKILEWLNGKVQKTS